MSSVSRSAIVPFSATQMYALVNDIESYPNFVPWCSKSSSKKISENEKQAALYFSRGAIKTSFTTRNTLSPDESIELHLVDGPFSQLHGSWKFVDIDGDGSHVKLDLEFEISNRMLKIALETFFSQICDRLVTSFVQRANDVYR
ncbi:MAG: type II toxin-antitoxin system RatA family toxin [Gammaproteobacteria bacterium]|nr:type II toxin-antitoxin system RatA family toxin [Gammaproteobacteria bacterium]